METLVKGIREWYGSDGLNFLKIRNSIENILINDGFNYYYGSLVSKRSVYENHIDSLGKDFLNNLISFKINNNDLIIAPESTMRVYDYLSRHKEISQDEGKIFYSQEFMRNEAKEDIDKGKTFTFWQIGFEIFGKKEVESSILALNTLENCLSVTNLPNIYIRISDKRILEGFLLNYSISERRHIYGLIDLCNEDGEIFYTRFVKDGGNKEIAKIIANLLDIKRINFTADNFPHLLTNEHSQKGYNSLQKIINTFNNNHKLPIHGIPFMPKSWDACDSLLFDARIEGYDYAIAGGGNLYAPNAKGCILKSGAGIGVTRITEYIINKHRKNENYYTV